MTHDDRGDDLAVGTTPDDRRDDDRLDDLRIEGCRNPGDVEAEADKAIVNEEDTVVQHESTSAVVRNYESALHPSVSCALYCGGCGWPIGILAVVLAVGAPLMLLTTWKFQVAITFKRTIAVPVKGRLAAPARLTIRARAFVVCAVICNVGYAISVSAIPSIVSFPVRVTSTLIIFSIILGEPVANMMATPVLIQLSACADSTILVVRESLLVWSRGG